MTARLTLDRIARSQRFKAAMQKAMRERGLTNRALANQLGVSETMVGYWTQGRYVPALGNAEKIATILNRPALLEIARVHHTGRCLACGRTFKRNSTRRQYCAQSCQRDYQKGVRGPTVVDPRQAAIDAFCKGCEPEGICRDDECALRAFSPFIFVPLRRVA